MATIVVCEGLLDGCAPALVAALGDDAAYVDPFTSADPAAYTFAALGDALAARGAPVVAVGGSLGSAAALAFARRHPASCAALVLLHPVVLYGRRPDLVDLGAAVRRLGPEATWSRLFPDRRAPGRDPGVVAAALEGLGDDVLLDGADDLTAVAAPTLVVARAGDPLHAMEVATAYWRTIPTSRMVNEVPGDVPLWDRPADLAARIRAFLREVGS